MKEFFIGLVLGAVLTTATGWYFLKARHTPAVRHAQDVTAESLRRAADTVEAKLVAWHLTNREIEAELAATGKVVRRRVSEFGVTVADTATDARIMAAIKAKYALDKELAPYSLGVKANTGRVSLSGNVSSAALIAKAILLAQETDGVREVVSTVKIQ